MTKVSVVKTIKTPKANKQFHTSNSPVGRGDSYGTGVKNPIGKSRDNFGTGMTTNSKIKKPPKNLA